MVAHVRVAAILFVHVTVSCALRSAGLLPAGAAVLNARISITLRAVTSSCCPSWHAFTAIG